MSVLLEAQSLVHGDRGKDYGHPLDDFSRTAAMWSAILGVPVTPEEVGLCMCAVKISRQCNAPKRDNLVDLAGYAETVQMVIDERKQRNVAQGITGHSGVIRGGTFANGTMAEYKEEWSWPDRNVLQEGP